MFAATTITPWHWAGFIVCILIFLALDLGVFHRRAHVVRFREALMWTIIWFSCAMLFAFVVAPAMTESWTKQHTINFITGYIIELSLSMDNVFVIALIFAYFCVPLEFQHRVLFWGIVGALVMRGLMIGVGVAIIREFNWVLYVMGAFLIFSGVKMIFGGDEEVHPEKNLIIRLARKFYPVSPTLDGQHFFTQFSGRRALTPLALVLICVETTDLIFAVDSIPAIFGVTDNGFIIFTSNVFAILGLRSLYFVLAGAIDYFRHLKTGLAVVLAFIGVKMLLDPHHKEARWFQIEIPNAVSLAIVGGIILISMAISIGSAKRDEKATDKRGPTPP
jgi:tellurite resistance protein TerC